MQEGNVLPREEIPRHLRDKPLAGRKLVEVLSGVPSEGGVNFSNWELAGGEAVRYDIRLDAKHNLLEDTDFWAKELASPADAYHFAFPCRTLTRAHSTPVVRTLEQPYGDGSHAEVEEANRLVPMRRITRIVGLLGSSSLSGF